MIYRNVYDEQIPALGFGTFQLSGSNCRSQVKEALKTGYRLIDTARAYRNETEVGEGIRDSGISREDVFLTSKIARDDLEPTSFKREAEESLLALRVDYLDLLLIHWPNQEIPLEETLGAMQDLVNAGKIRFLGVSNFPPSLFKQACELAPVFTNQVEYHPLLGQNRNKELARNYGNIITAYSPLGQGLVMSEPTLTEIGKTHGKNPAQVALRWLLQQEEVVTIPRSSSPEHLRSNFEIFDFELSAEEMTTIDSLPKNRRLINPTFAPDWEE